MLPIDEKGSDCRERQKRIRVWFKYSLNQNISMNQHISIQVMQGANDGR